MATPTYTALASFTATGGETSVTFGSISGYRDVTVVFDIKTPSDTNPRMRYNGDSGSNYPYAVIYNNLSNNTALSGAETIDHVPLNVSPYTAFWGQAQILDASAGDKHKTTLIRGNNTGEYVLAYVSRWANNNPITSIEFYLTASSLIAGSTVTLFGIEA